MNPDTQLEAFATLKNKENKQELVFRAIESYQGLTLFELVKILGWQINRISGRLSELNKQGKIVDSGLRKINPESNKKAIIWSVK